MGWVFSFALFVTWLIGHDSQVLIASAIFAVAGAVATAAFKITNKEN